MRFMLLIKANADSEAGVMPGPELIDAMGRYNTDLVNAGILLAGDGLHASAKGARVTFAADGKKTVTDGPFTETKELIAGFWIIQVPSRDEAVEWATRVPMDRAGEIEVRQVVEADDLGENMTPEARAAEQRLSERIAEQHGG